MWSYIIVAITFLVIGFVVCSMLSANNYDRDFTFDDLPESEEDD